ncbi:putative leucine-rich repeat domain superfamily, winged helix-like DNA-binding domain superfamily [Helianthus annuus]|nr:putative leucine-rich repeat domain superfamily, winged helix-like DNA-binding domain superfamily [Helianthus annuus]KAJ0499050.1 putative leucine-rich repeat domain superfamily, winged helix-like DNA-binding domain superfamily [Helianthus annuus]KAJ0665064.1 putative leucine-rich repeat domain superfamily, winged helix-like DNA-binding domain superfamily [Helianthus annuus]KAJ0672484.1 putative leucine-rich repeat domain superfamily, winged helix-like DNA-binding domain superfamily [Helianth
MQVPALRLSYSDLSASLKQLFAYCSLFPKDFMFDKEELVLLWAAEGFLHQSTPIDSTKERLGHDCFDELLSRSFFQLAPNNQSFFVMHDLMNDLAASVASEFFVRLENDMKRNIRKEMLEKYRHMSFSREEYVTYKKFETFKIAKSLRTFLATFVGAEKSWQDFYLSSKILIDLLPELPMLRVLSLSGFCISEVPQTIGSLRHLRYLNLSRTKVTHLPENVCNLYNLETLIVCGCFSLAKLPNNFLKLKNLRHLDIRDTPLLNQMPFGICELKSLQTLSKIVIGGERGFEIARLKEFKNLCGKIRIVGLDKVQNAIHVREANFSQKRLSELEIVWSDEPNGSRNEMLEKEVLDELKPRNDKLLQLKIISYGGLKLPDWVGNPSFLHLKHVSLSNCKRCRYLPPLGQLPLLKELFIEGLRELEDVGLELLGTSCAFPSLEILSFKHMHEWKKWSTTRGVVFPCLRQLVIKFCPNLVEISLEALPSLNVLEIAKCDSGLLKRLIEIASAVTKLNIESLTGLNDVVWRGIIEYLGVVEELEISRCDEIRYLWKSEAVASKVLVKLRSLDVVECHGVVSLGETEEEDNCESNLWTSLRNLKVSSCRNMERFICPDSIQVLCLWHCKSITVLSFPKEGQKLKSVDIWGCNELLETEWGGQNMNNNNRSSMPMLENVWIKDWTNLKSVKKLNYLVHLTTLWIVNCENLESFPDNELSDLTLLKELRIIDCPSMDASFPRGIWPPKLQSLEIGMLKNPISNWGPQNFPTSLVKLFLVGDDGVSSCSQFSHLLPLSLTSLSIVRFEKLESFSMGLQHLQRLSFYSCPHLNKLSHPHPQNLTNLQKLKFFDCPSMMDLPEVLLPSLFCLIISGCPHLKEKCSKRGCYWPLVSYIPCVSS